MTLSRSLWLLMILGWLAPAAAQHFAQPECPEASDPTCFTEGSVADEDFDNTNRDASASAAFVADSGGFLAEAEAMQRLGDVAQVSDTTASGGAYVWLPFGVDEQRSQLVGRGITAGTYYIWMRVANAAIGPKPVWVRPGQFTHPLDNTAAGNAGNAELPQWTTVALGAYERLVPLETGGPSWQTGVNTTQQRTITVGADGVIRFVISQGMQLDQVFLHADATATPPFGQSVNYEILKSAAATPTNCADTRFAAANVLLWDGYNTGNDAFCTVRMFHRGGNELAICATCPDTDLRGGTRTTDQLVASDDAIQLYIRDSLSQAVRDAGTTRNLCYARNGAIYDANFPDNVATTAYSGTPTCTATLTGDYDNTTDDTQVEYFWKMNPGFTIVDGMRVRAEMSRFDADGLGSTAYQHTYHTAANVDNPANWSIWRFSSVTLGAADVTAPTVGALSCANNVTASSFTCSWTTSEPSTCAVRLDTDNDNAVSGADVLSEVNCGASSGGSCACQVTGLSANTAYEAQGTATDLAGNAANTAVGDQTTSAAATGLFLSTTGTDNGVCGSGAPCKTWAHVLPLLDPGETLTLANGTYTGSNSGYPNINCGTGGNARNGTAAQPITITAQNERQAWLKVTGSVIGFEMANCAYWRIEGLRVSGTDNANALRLNNIVNSTFRRNLFHHQKRIGNVHLMLCERCHGNLIEENELYYFYRHGISLHESNNNVVRRNYVNSRAYPDYDLTSDSLSPSRGDDAITIYPGNDNIVENNISVGNYFGGAVIAANPETGLRNKFYGNISIGDLHGFRLVARVNGGMPQDNEFHHNLIVDVVSGYGFDIGSTKRTLTRNNTVYSSGGYAFFASDRQSGANFGCGDGIFSYTSVNDGAVSTTKTGFFLDATFIGARSNCPSGATLTFSLTNPGAFGNNPNFGPTAKGISATHANIVGEVTSDPQLGNCRVYIPSGSSWKGAGESAGEDIGATILYAYQRGVLTTTKLWNTADGGRWALKGATVSGTNTPGVAGVLMTNPDINTTTDSAHTVHTLLNITSSGCQPPGY